MKIKVSIGLSLQQCLTVKALLTPSFLEGDTQGSPGSRSNPRLDHRLGTGLVQEHHSVWHVLSDWISSAKEAIIPDKSNTVVLDSDDSSLLLVLLCFLDVFVIQKDVLIRGGTPHKRWNKHGEIDEISPSESGINEHLIEICSDEGRLNAALEILVTASLLHANPDFQELSMTLYTRDRIIARLPDNAKICWKYQALLLVCHGFPRDQHLEPRHDDLVQT